MTDIYEQAAEALAEHNAYRSGAVGLQLQTLAHAMAEELARVKAKMEAAEELAKEASEAVRFLVENGIAAQTLAKSIMAFRTAGETPK